MPRPINVTEVLTRTPCTACKEEDTLAYVFRTLPEREELMTLCPRCLAFALVGVLVYERVTVEELLRWVVGQ